MAVLPRAAHLETLSNSDCLMCHADASIARSTGGSVHVDAAALKASVHATLSCTRCHRVSSVPHAAALPPPRCASCHRAEATAVAGGAHGRSPAGAEKSCTGCHGPPHAVRPARMAARSCSTCHARAIAAYGQSVHAAQHARGDVRAAVCRDCHGSAHTLLAHTDPRAPTARTHVVALCGRCHGDATLLAGRDLALPQAYLLFRQSVHGRSSRADAAVCIDCHGSHAVRRAADPGSTIYRTAVPATCGRCHQSELRAYSAGIHGVALARGVTAAPVCTDCHGEHLIRGPRDANSPVGHAGVTRTCARCHEAQGIRETYGLPAGRLKTYEDSYHGLALRGGSPVVANCASCHGYHEIRPSRDPRSTVNPKNLGVTCGKCHAGRQLKIGRTPVHLTAASRDEPAVFYVRRIYIAVIIVVIGGMALHNGLDFAIAVRRHWRRQRKGRRAAGGAHPDRMIERLTLNERIQHALLMVSFFTLVYTGFALKFPEAWPFAWLAHLEHGYAWRGLIHRGAALVLVVVSLYHVVWLAGRRGRFELKALLLRPRDVRDTWQALLHLVGLRRRPARVDRFGYVEKAEYWALVWGTTIMTVTGFVLWFENHSLRAFGKLVLDLSTVVHYYEAWLAFLAILVWHVYHTVLRPDVYPMDWSWITGKISEHVLRREHRDEWRRLAGRKTETPEKKPS